MSPDKPDTFSNGMMDVDLSSGMSGLALGTPGGGVGEGAGSSFDVSVMTDTLLLLAQWEMMTGFERRERGRHGGDLMMVKNWIVIMGNDWGVVNIAADLNGTYS